MSTNKEGKEQHECKFDELAEVHVPIRRYVKEHGKMIADTMTGKDVLKQRKCKCGKTETYDLERTRA